MRRTATTTTIALAAFALLLLGTLEGASACASCLGSLALSGAGIQSTSTAAAERPGTAPQHQHHHRHALPPSAQASVGIAGVSKTPAGRSPVSKSALSLLAVRQLLARADVASVIASFLSKSRMTLASESSDDGAPAASRASSNNDKSDTTSTTTDSAPADPDALQDLLSDDNYETPEQRGVDPDCMARSKEGRMTAGMTGAIGFYKGWISPILPPACRFVPTCSQYGVQAIQEFGPARGALLTAWRLLRCSPLGGKGYDPPRWPPVPYNYASY